MRDHAAAHEVRFNGCRERGDQYLNVVEPKLMGQPDQRLVLLVRTGQIAVQ
jgi:hypothetical protein